MTVSQLIVIFPSVPEDFTWREVGSRIRSRREGRRLTQVALANVAHMTQAGLARIEAGETNPQIETLQRIASVLDTTVRELICGGEAQTDREWLHASVDEIENSGNVFAIVSLRNGLELAQMIIGNRPPHSGLGPADVDELHQVEKRSRIRPGEKSGRKR